MRPIELIIKNFLSYGDTPQTINLNINSIISFTGNNGHGKSALLEAITWALWGQARRGQGVSKSDDMIMHIGSSLMFVTLIIKVKNDYYKIHRTCEKKQNRILTGLELYSCNEKTEINLSSSHQKDTQLLIEKIIGISYDMFINTVYLKQGSSNEFSKKTAKERKDILCSILKIDQIEEIRQKILEDIKIIFQERAILLKLEERLLDKKKELQLEQYQLQANHLHQEIDSIKTTLKIAEEGYRFSENEFEKKNQEYTQKIKTIDMSQKNIQSLYTNYTIENMPYQQYKKASIEIEKIKNKTQSHINIIQIKKELSALEENKKLIQEEQTQSITQIQLYRQHELESINQKIVTFLENADECKVFQLKQELYYIEKILLENTESLERCFFCLSNQNDTIKKNISDHISQLQNKKQKIEKDILRFTQEKNSVLAEFEMHKKELVLSIENKINTLNTEFKNKIDSIESKKKEYYTLEIAYNDSITYKEKLNFLQQEIDSFQIKESQEKLKKIIRAIYENKIKIKDLLFITKNEKIDLDNKYNQLSSKTTHLESKKRELFELEKKFAEMTNYISLLTEQINQDIQELLTTQEKIKQIESNLKIKSNLAHILSKNNLQAALIEEAIPIIEEEANIILQKLTNGSSKIYIESIKDLKSGSIKETLDIKIADQIGIRYYEFFSGGESFRIDLALRIALVKLLAQKSGHYIKTFIIDEGFGSQDSQSLEIMIDTLYLLQNEFDLIIIISHLNDMKEQFPVQFFIEKTINGSIIKQI